MESYQDTGLFISNKRINPLGTFLYLGKRTLQSVNRNNYRVTTHLLRLKVIIFWIVLTSLEVNLMK